MTIKRLHVGPRLSQVAIHGNTVYTAGIVAGDAVRARRAMEAILAQASSEIATVAVQEPLPG
jgi:enamine deaminase RidA (YjgF/YER057c/UK114 family)